MYYEPRNHTVQTTTVRRTYLFFILLIMAPGFDLRPFLYPSRFPWQFRKIDEVAAALPDRSEQGAVGDKTKTE